jgi:hypothetical protein
MSNISEILSEVLDKRRSRQCEVLLYFSEYATLSGTMRGELGDLHDDRLRSLAATYPDARCRSSCQGAGRKDCWSRIVKVGRASHDEDVLGIVEEVGGSVADERWITSAKYGT